MTRLLLIAALSIACASPEDQACAYGYEAGQYMAAEQVAAGACVDASDMWLWCYYEDEAKADACEECVVLGFDAAMAEACDGMGARPGAL